MLLLGGMVVHLVIAYASCFWRTKSFEPEKAINRVFDSATFSGSALVLVGLVEPSVLALLGSTKPFLLIAGVVGVIYGLHSMFR